MLSKSLAVLIVCKQGWSCFSCQLAKDWHNFLLAVAWCSATHPFYPPISGTTSGASARVRAQGSEPWLCYLGANALVFMQSRAKTRLLKAINPALKPVLSRVCGKFGQIFNERMLSNFEMKLAFPEANLWCNVPLSVKGYSSPRLKNWFNLLLCHSIFSSAKVWHSLQHNTRESGWAGHSWDSQQVQREPTAAAVLPAQPPPELPRGMIESAAQVPLSQQPPGQPPRDSKVGVVESAGILRLHIYKHNQTRTCIQQHARASPAAAVFSCSSRCSFWLADPVESCGWYWVSGHFSPCLFFFFLSAKVRHSRQHNAQDCYWAEYSWNRQQVPPEPATLACPSCQASTWSAAKVGCAGPSFPAPHQPAGQRHKGRRESLSLHTFWDHIYIYTDWLTGHSSQHLFAKLYTSSSLNYTQQLRFIYC